MSVRRPIFGAILATALLITGCDDPSNVGQGLLDAQGNDTEVVRLSPLSIEASETGDVTGGNAASGAVRALFGEAADPVVGTLTSTGLVDFVPASQFESGFVNGTVSWAGLEFNVDYSYGDTSGVLTFDLHAVPDTWQSTALRADSLIAIGSVIASYEIPASTGIVSLELPQDWVSEYDPLLRSSEFTDNFHGFALVPQQADAVLGIRFSESRLRASTTPGDTVAFALSKVASLTDDAAVQMPSGDVVLRDGSTGGLDLRFQFEGGALEPSLIHRVIIKLRTTDWSASYPAGFARPLPGVLSVHGVSADGATRVDIGEVPINQEGVFIVDNTTLTNVFQSANLGKSVLDRFELSFPAEQSGVGFMSFSMDPADVAVEALITVSPLN